MTKALIKLQDLRRRIYRKAKSEKTHRFWGIFVHVTKIETLRQAYEISKRNGGSPGIDGLTFEQIEENGLSDFLLRIREELINNTYKPMPNRKVEISKGNGKSRILQIPCIKDRVVQGALKLILEAIFEADFCDNSYGFRPKRSQHRALAEVRRSIQRRMFTIIDVDLSKYFDNIKHAVLLDKVAKRVEDSKVLKLIKQVIKVTGKIGLPQGGPLSPLLSNIYLNELDWYFDHVREKTASKGYEYLNYHRFADDIVIAVTDHHSKSGWARRALLRLKEKLKPLGVSLNQEKTKIVNVTKGESFIFLGFDLRRIQNKSKTGYFVLLTPTKKARLEIKAKIKEIIKRGGSAPVEIIVAKLNEILTGWVNYFRVGNSNKAFSEVRDYLEMKIRILLTRRKRRRKRSIGWQRWSNKYIYGTLGLFWDWKISHLKGAEVYR